MKKQNIMTNDAIFSKQTLSHMCKKKAKEIFDKKVCQNEAKIWVVRLRLIRNFIKNFDFKKERKVLFVYQAVHNTTQRYHCGGGGRVVEWLNICCSVFGASTKTHFGSKLASQLPV